MIKERQREGRIACMIRSIGRNVRGLMVSDRTKVANTVMKQFKAIEASVAKGTHPCSLHNAIIDGSWPIAISKAKEAPTEEATEAESDEEGTLGVLKPPPHTYMQWLRSYKK